MPGDPKLCREHAQCCLKQAAAASTSMVRDNFLSLAQSWMRLARELEASERLLAALELGALDDAARHDAPDPRNQALR